MNSCINKHYKIRYAKIIKAKYEEDKRYIGKTCKIDSTSITVYQDIRDKEWCMHCVNIQGTHPYKWDDFKFKELSKMETFLEMI